jgi:hypothetical protein
MRKVIVIKDITDGLNLDYCQKQHHLKRRLVKNSRLFKVEISKLRIGKQIFFKREKVANPTMDFPQKMQVWFLFRKLERFLVCLMVKTVLQAYYI